MDLPFARTLGWKLGKSDGGEGLRLELLRALDAPAGSGSSFSRDGIDIGLKLEGDQLTLSFRDEPAIRRAGNHFLFGRLASSVIGIGILWALAPKQPVQGLDPHAILAIVIGLAFIVGLRRAWSNVVEPRLQHEERERMERVSSNVVSRVERVLRESGLDPTRVA